MAPAPIPTPTQTTKPTTQTTSQPTAQPTEPQPTKTAPPKPTTSTATPPAKKGPQTTPRKIQPQTKGSSSKTTVAQRDQEAMRQSKAALARTGVVTISSDEETPTPPPQQETDNESSKRKQTRNLVTTGGSTRPRSRGTLAAYALYLLKVGGYSKEQANEVLSGISAKEFIDTTKPGMSNSYYQKFSKFVGRREEESIVRDLQAFEVSIPSFLIPGNPDFVDTSVPSQKVKKRKRTREQSETTVESSMDESGPQKVVTRLLVNYSNATGEADSFYLKFTRGQLIGTLIKKIKSKLGVSQTVRLTRNSTKELLDESKTAAELDIQNKEEVTVVLVEPEQEESGITIRIQIAGGSRIWTKSVEPYISTTNLYMQYA